ncbi:MAG: hypothetical protein HRU15_11205 [Planctomycetes bacterium]|nr:hypothetical protein [Planctomycetota bacterium]
MLIEYVGMTCGGCNAFLGGNIAGIGPYPGQYAQKNLKSMAEYLPTYGGGLKLTDKRFTYVIVLFYGLDGSTAPNLKDAQSYAQHYKLTEKENHVVLFGDASFINKTTYNMIPGFHLIDSDWKVVSASTGHKPKHNFYTHTIPALKKLVK